MALNLQDFSLATICGTERRVVKRVSQHYIFLRKVPIGYIVRFMNKRSVKGRPAKISPDPVAGKSVSPQLSAKPKPSSARAIVGADTTHHVAVQAQSLRAHKFRVGQTVLYTSSPITRPGASGTYKVVKLLPSDGDDYQYRIKNPGEAFERVAKESQLELDH